MNKKRLQASVTLEAALILPFFLYMMLNLLTMFDALRVQTALYASLHQAGREIGAKSFDVRFAADAAGAQALAQTGGVQVAGNLFSAAYAKARVKEYLTEMAPNLRCVEGGADAVSFLRSGFLSNGDIIDLVATCRIRPFISIAGFDAFPVEAVYYAHAWTGYSTGGDGEGEGAAQEETVYVTPNGEVYHRSPDCTYLRPRVSAVSADSLTSRRNQSGAIYYPCESCGGGCGTVYLTPYGDRYHASATCKKISHEVQSVPLDEVYGRRACSKCGGAH